MTTSASTGPDAVRINFMQTLCYVHLLRWWRRVCTPSHPEDRSSKISVSQADFTASGLSCYLLAHPAPISRVESSYSSI